MKYRASMDSLTKGITIGITILFAVLIFAEYSGEQDAGKFQPTFLSCFLILTYLTAFAFRPIGYELTTGELIICRPIKNVRISIKQIRNVELVDRKDMGIAIRTFGVGGLFGYYGKFASTKLGNMTWYGTRTKGTVLIHTYDNKKIILTPDDINNFITSFNVKR